MKIDIYSKEDCPFCTKAKQFFNDNNVQYKEVDLSDDKARQRFYKRYEVNSVPQIFIDRERIGGYDDLLKIRSKFEGPRLLQEKKAYVHDYKAPVELAKQQNEVFWLADEIEVEKDVQDIMVNFTEAERHGVITVLKLFTLYELVAGNEYWGGRIKETFKRPDVRMMANAFSYFEVNVHAEFYNKLNEALHLNNEEFYMGYVNDPILSERMNFIDWAVDHEDILTSLAVFSMVEGAVLYSSFAFLKHFQSKGKNKLLNVVRGINFSVRDEALHMQGGTWLYNQLKEEMSEADMLKDQEKREKVIYDAAVRIYEHEARIVDMIFEQGDIDGITKTQMTHFIESRINECLVQLGLEKIYQVSYNPIAEWFYDGINATQFHDFFTGIGNAYNRNWNELGFTWEDENV